MKPPTHEFRTVLAPPDRVGLEAMLDADSAHGWMPCAVAYTPAGSGFLVVYQREVSVPRGRVGDPPPAPMAKLEAKTCTGVAARWCPIHGQCTDTGKRLDGHCDDRQCPLHGDESTHGPSERRVLDGDFVSRLAEARLTQIVMHREAYLSAWIAETGLKPSECELVEDRNDPMRVVVSVRRRLPPPAPVPSVPRRRGTYGATADPTGNRHLVGRIDSNTQTICGQVIGMDWMNSNDVFTADSFRGVKDACKDCVRVSG